MPRNRWRTDSLVVVSWNVWESTQPEESRSSLIRYIRAYRPEFFVLRGAADYYKNFEGLGYNLVEFEPNTSDHLDECALLIRSSKGGPKVKKPFLKKDSAILLKWKKRVWRISNVEELLQRNSRRPAIFIHDHELIPHKNCVLLNSQSLNDVSAKRYEFEVY